MTAFFGHLGRQFFDFLRALTSIAWLLRETVEQTTVLLTNPRKRHQTGILRQVYEIGMQSLPLVLTMASLIGVALTVLMSFQMKEVGSYGFIPGVIAVVICREMGPLVTGLIIASRVGAAFTARIGTMKISEELLALETMAINPVRFLVVQRFLGMLLSLPALTILFISFSLASSLLFSFSKLGIRPDAYLEDVFDVVIFTDVLSSIVKAVFFAVAIVLIACYRGLTVEGGPEEVGRSTMQAVVSCMIAIIVFDTILTMLFYG